MADRKQNTRSTTNGDKNIINKISAMLFKSPLRRDSATSVMDLNDKNRRSRDRVGRPTISRPSHPVGRSSQPNYRVHIPSTRLSSRASVEETTDSLKLYEEQIRNYTPSDGKRPLSLCFDFVSLDDAHPPSSSSSSTMSSSSSSNSQNSSGCNVSGSREELVMKKDHRASPLFKNESPVHGKFSSIWNGTPPYVSQNETREDRPLSPGRRLSAPSPNFSRSTSTTSSRTSSVVTVVAASGTTTSSIGEIDSSILDDDDADDPSPLTPSATNAEEDSDSENTPDDEEDEDSSEDEVILCTGGEGGHVTILRSQPLLLSSSVGVGLLGQERYDLSTLDIAYRDMLQVEVHEVKSGLGVNGSAVSRSQENLDHLLEDDLLERVCAFNGNRWGLTMGVLDANPRVAGSIRIFMNLIKPIKMSLQQMQRSTSSSSSSSNSGPNSPPAASTAAASERPTANQPSPKSAEDRIADAMPVESQQLDKDNPAGVVSFFLPRGTPKLLHITSSTTTNEVIEILLKKFHIQESPRKFALFEHTLENEFTVYARQFDSGERPLVTLLSWAADGRQALEEALTKKRIVLQENEDSGEVKWNEFSLPELQNFLRILGKEETEYKEAIYEQYGLMRHHMISLLKVLRSSESTEDGYQADFYPVPPP